MEQIISIAAKHTRSLLSNSFSLLLALHFSFHMYTYSNCIYRCQIYTPRRRKVSVVSIISEQQIDCCPRPRRDKIRPWREEKEKNIFKTTLLHGGGTDGVVCVVWWIMGLCQKD